MGFYHNSLMYEKGNTIVSGSLPAQNDTVVPGKFELGAETVDGILILSQESGDGPVLKLWGQKHCLEREQPTILGHLHDGRKTVVHGNRGKVSVSSIVAPDEPASLTIRPVTATVGAFFPQPDKATIKQAKYSSDEMGILFRRGDINIPKIGELGDGDTPCEITVEWGRVEVSRNVSCISESGELPRHHVTINITLTFSEPVTLDYAVTRTRTVLQFFDLLLGFPQNLSDLWLSGDLGNVRVWDCLEKIYPNVGLLRHRPLGPIAEPANVEKMLKVWLEDTSWAQADNTFRLCFTRQTKAFTEDRLVLAANMFDQISRDAVGGPGTVRCMTSDEEDVHKKVKEILESLPCDSVVRKQLWNDLGRLGRLTLKERIERRVDVIVRHMPGNDDKFITWLKETCRMGVDCRNVFTHRADKGKGVTSRLSQDFNSIRIMTQTLEFVYLSARLLELGLDMNHWRTTAALGGHYLLDDYWVLYKEDMEYIEQVMDTGR